MPELRDGPLVHLLELCPQFRVVAAQLFQFPDPLKGAAPAGTAVVYPIQPAPIKAPVIADFQGLRLRDAPLHQRIFVILDALRLVGGDAQII